MQPSYDGCAVTGKNGLSVNIQGCDWYEIRVSKDGYTRARALRLMAPLNAVPTTGMSRKCGRRVVLFDSAGRSRALEAAGRPTWACARRDVQATFKGVRERILMKNIAYVGRWRR